MAETQESATGIAVESKEIETTEVATQHPVAETQEQATDSESEEIKTLNAATKHPVVETQQPATDVEIKF